MNIRYVDGNNSCYRLRGEPVQLTAKSVKLDANGKIESMVVETVAEIYAAKVRARGPRKQTAARQMRPTGRVVVVERKVATPEVAIARFEGGGDREVQIAILERKIKELMGMVERQTQPIERELDLSGMLAHFAALKTK